MRIAEDPLGGYAYRCTYCRTNVGSLQLYAATRNVTFYEASKEISKRVAFPSGLATSRLGEYRAALDEAEALRGYLEAASDDLVHRPHAAWTSTLNHLRSHCSRSGSFAWRVIQGHYCGVSRHELETLTGLRFDTGDREDLAIAIPYCDVFDRVSCLWLVNQYGGSCRVHVGLSRTFGAAEGGLCFLDEASVGSPIVYAVGVPQLACQLRSQGLRDELYCPPVVGWWPDTVAAWRCIRADKVIMWAPTLDVEVYRQALSLPRCFVASEPSIEGANLEELQAKLSGLPVVGWRKVVNKSAVPCLLSLCRWLAGMPPSSAVEQVDSLGLSDQIKQDLLDSIPPVDGTLRSAIRVILGLSRETKVIKVGGDPVEQVGSEWFSVGPDGQLRRLMNATLALDKLLVGPKGETEVKGALRLGDAVIPFTAPMDDVAGNTLRWIRQLCIAAGKAMPEVDPAWANRLFAVAQAFTNPESVSTARRVGYSETEDCFVFPTFRVVGGKVEPRTTLEFPEVVPGAELEPPALMGVGDRVETGVTVTETVGWLLVSTIVANLARQAVGGETRGIGVACGPDEVGTYLVLNLAKAMSLPVIRLEGDAGEDPGHGLPVVIDARGVADDVVERYLADPGERSVILLANGTGGWAVSGGGAWVVIDGSGLPKEFDYRVAVSALFSAVARMQVSAFPENSYAKLSSVLEVVMSRLELLDPGVFYRGAASRVYGDDEWDTTSVDRCLFPVLFASSIRSGLVEYLGDGPVDRVRVRIKMASEWLRDNGKPTMSVRSITRALLGAGKLLSESASSVEVTRETWDEVTRRWEATKIPKLPPLLAGDDDDPRPG